MVLFTEAMSLYKPPSAFYVFVLVSPLSLPFLSRSRVSLTDEPKVCRTARQPKKSYPPARFDLPPDPTIIYFFPPLCFVRVSGFLVSFTSSLACLFDRPFTAGTAGDKKSATSILRSLVEEEDPAPNPAGIPSKQERRSVTIGFPSFPWYLF